jgi:hypothetical protein
MQAVLRDTVRNFKTWTNIQARDGPDRSYYTKGSEWLVDHFKKRRISFNAHNDETGSETEDGGRVSRVEQTKSRMNPRKIRKYYNNANRK